MRKKSVAEHIVLHKKGSTILTTPVIIALGILIVTSLIVLAVQVLVPYLWYEKLSSTCIKYVYIMEEFGYLTSQEAKALKEDLKEQGFDVDKLNMKYTNYRTSYGDPIYLKLAYDYEMKLPFQKAQTIEMKVERNSVSKR